MQESRKIKKLGSPEKVPLTKKAVIMVAIDAPMKPSHVFFGDSLIKGVFPKKKPKK